MLKKSALFFLALLFWALPASAEDPPLYQLSTIQALLAGHYDGLASVGSLRKYGDFGLGTFDQLDGEMVVLDGQVYQVPADGTVRIAPDGLGTPFATVAFAKPSIVREIAAFATLAELESALDALLPSVNQFYAVRVEGRFASLKTRSVPAQRKPYPKLIEVVKTQALFDFRDIAGTLVGFRSPEFAKGMTVPGYHLHFIDVARSKGGHLLDCAANGARVEITVLPRWLVDLPEQGGALALPRADDEELRKVEK